MSDIVWPKIGNVRVVQDEITGDFKLVYDDPKDLDNLEVAAPEVRMDYESGKEPKVPPYNCQVGYHNDVWYEGITERYWFCTNCDRKDLKKPPPAVKRKIR